MVTKERILEIIKQETEDGIINYISPEEIDNCIAEKIFAEYSGQLEPLVSLQKGEHENKFGKLRDYILEKEKEGIAVLMTSEGLGEINLDDLINQPAEGILYDLNRDRITVLTFTENQKWVNDYAVGLVIIKLKALLSN